MGIEEGKAAMAQLLSARSMRMAGNAPVPMDVDAPGSWFVTGRTPELLVRRFWEFDDAKQQFVCVCTVEAPVEEPLEEKRR